MRKWQVSRTAGEISGHFAGMAGLQDGIAGLAPGFGRFGAKPKGRRTVPALFPAPARRAGRGRYGESMTVAGPEIGGTAQAGSGTIEGPRARTWDEVPRPVSCLCRPSVQQAGHEGHKSSGCREIDFLLLNVSGNSDEAGFRIEGRRRNEEREAVQVGLSRLVARWN